MRVLVTLVTLLWMSCLALAQSGPLDYVEAFRMMPVQQGGRLKPFDTFARESVRYVTGKVEFEKRDPVETLLAWWQTGPSEMAKKPVVEFRNKDWKSRLGLAAEPRYYSLEQLRASTELARIQEELHQLQPGQKVPRDLSVPQELLGKMRFFEMLCEGTAWTMVPSPEGLEQSWMALGQLEEAQALQVTVLDPVRKSVRQLRQALTSQSGRLEAVVALRQSLAAVGPTPSVKDMGRELHYNQFHPFRKAWMLYLFSLVCLFLTTSRGGALYWTALGAASTGIALHAYGFYLRCMIAGRAPVTNMYESVIWVGFGAVAFALIFESIYRARSYLMAACAGAVVCLLLADQLPAVLDPSIRPLMPVLRSNFWLTIHVLTITLGYAAFLLALGLGHMVLWRYLVPDQREELAGLHTALYPAPQGGVLLLAAGTLLGGVWANYSWGRFWGWDPKEVWALIALLGYLAILHARYTGWAGNFGTAAFSVLAFQGVLMAWYGVNFVLGAGLHSYGFGTGGVEYVGMFCLAEVLFVAFVAWRVKARACPPA